LYHYIFNIYTLSKIQKFYFCNKKTTAKTRKNYKPRNNFKEKSLKKKIQTKMKFWKKKIQTKINVSSIVSVSIFEFHNRMPWFYPKLLF